MTLPSDPAARHREVAGRFTGLVEATTDWSAPSPVAGWTAYDVVDHLVTWLPGLLSSVGAPLPSAHIPFKRTVRTPDTPGETASDRSFERLHRAWAGQVAAVQALLEDPASAARVVEDPNFPAMTLTQMVDRLYTTDVFMHTWDLARATGQDDRLDAEHCEELFAGMLPMDALLRSSGQYGARVPVPDDAPAQDRLLGFIGRDPHWSPDG